MRHGSNDRLFRILCLHAVRRPCVDKPMNSRRLYSPKPRALSTKRWLLLIVLVAEKCRSPANALYAFDFGAGIPPAETVFSPWFGSDGSRGPPIMKPGGAAL